MITISIILLFLSVILIIISYNNFKKVKTINSDIDEKNLFLENKSRKLEGDITFLEHRIKELSEQEQQGYDKIQTLNNLAEESIAKQQSVINTASDNYFQIIENRYLDKEKEYDNLIIKLEKVYDEKHTALNSQIENAKNELSKLQASRDAIIAAQIKEKEIKEKLEFYCLCPKTSDIEDVRKLESIKSSLHQPRILSMLIWSTYFQKPMSALCTKILGIKTVCGIYKITNQETDECYIGQSVDVAKRWKDHAKCGLGIDTPAGNKLYNAMQDIGIWNFSWELLEECPREQIDEKEKLYIALYRANEYGYNSTKGNN